jgi:hypothetical protein
MAKTSIRFQCPHCDYSTARKYNLTLHLSRKKTCKPKEIESTNATVSQITPKSHINGEIPPKSHINGEILHTNSPDPNNSTPEHKTNVCKYCDKSFSRIDSLKRHLNTCKAKKATASEDNAEVKELREEIKKLRTELTEKETGPQVINNYITNNNDNSTTTNTTNNVINLNNFDSPSLDHITSQMIGEMYLKADRELPRMIGKAVRSIYKGDPENDCIRIKYGNQAGFAEVRQDDETRILPMSDVLETVLSQTSTLCGKELQKCVGNDAGQIPGPNVVNHVNELSVLHWGFVPETHAQRQGYFKFVKSALM